MIPDITTRPRPRPIRVPYQPARPDLAYQIRARMRSEWAALSPCGRWQATDGYARGAIGASWLELLAFTAATSAIVLLVALAAIAAGRMGGGRW